MNDKDEIDLERVVTDPDYRRAVMRRLNGDGSEAPPRQSGAPAGRVAEREAPALHKSDY